MQSGAVPYPCEAGVGHGFRDFIGGIDKKSFLKALVFFVLSLAFCRAV